MLGPSLRMWKKLEYPPPPWGCNMSLCNMRNMNVLGRSNMCGSWPEGWTGGPPHSTEKSQKYMVS